MDATDSNDSKADPAARTISATQFELLLNAKAEFAKIMN